MNSDWQEIDFEGSLSLRAPADLEPAQAHAIDSSVGSWQSADLSLMMDLGLFSDPLIGYAEKATYRTSEEEIDGVAARLIAFDEADGTRVQAAHFVRLPGDRRGSLTLFLRAAPQVGHEILLEVLRSIRFTSTQTPE